MWTNYVFTKIMGGGHFINIPNEMLHSKRAIMILSGDWSKPNQPRPTFMKKCKQPKHKYSMPLQATLHLFTCSCRKKYIWQWQNFISLSLSSSKSDKEIYTPIVNLLFYRVISPTSKHSFRITTLNFPIFARQHLCFGLFMSTCIKLVCFTYVTC